MNYQLLTKLYSFWISLSDQKIELLSLEFENQIMHININKDFAVLNWFPPVFVKGLI